MLQTRTSDAKDASSYLITVRRGATVVRGPKPMRDYMADDWMLPAAAGYFVEVESCSSEDAERIPDVYGQWRYVGTSTSFNVYPMQSVNVAVNCTAVNAAFSVAADDSFTEYFGTNYSVSATVLGRTLNFTDAGKTGYFNLGSDGTAQLSYTLSCDTPDGTPYSVTRTATLHSAQSFVLNLYHTSEAVPEDEFTINFLPGTNTDIQL